MHSDTPNYPIWTTSVSIPRGTLLEYKFVKKKTSFNGLEQFDWEQLLIGNRKVETYSRSKVVLFEHFSDASVRREDILPANVSTSRSASMTIPTHQIERDM